MKNAVISLFIFYFSLFAWSEVPVDPKLKLELPTVTPKFKKMIVPLQLKYINVVKTISPEAYKNYVEHYGSQKIESSVYIKDLKEIMSKISPLIVRGDVNAMQQNQAIKILIDSTLLAEGEKVLSVPFYQKTANKDIDFYIPSEYTASDVASVVIKEGMNKCAIYNVLGKDSKITKVFINIK